MHLRTSLRFILRGGLLACLFSSTLFAGEPAVAPPTPAELAARLESLKIEVARLEQAMDAARVEAARGSSAPLVEVEVEPVAEKAAEASEGTVPPAVAPSLSALSTLSASPSPAAPQPELSPTLHFLNRVNISGSIDGYQQYNANQPADRIAGLRAFTGPSNQLSLNLAQLAFTKAPTADSRAGFALSFAYGEVINVVNGSEPVAGPDFAQNLKEAYLSYLVTDKLQLDFGKWVTPIGAELIEAGGNWNYSRGLLFTWAIPFYHYGLRANYAINSKTWVTAHLANGWNNIVENNSGKSFAIQAGFSPVENVSIVQNYMVGPELTDDDSLRHVFDTIVTYDYNDKISFLVNYDYGMEEGLLPTDPDSKWQGVAGYVRYAFDDKMATSSRMEWFQDDDAWSTGVAQQVKEFTQTFEYRLADGLQSRFEFRRDWSTAPFFLKGANRFVQNQTTFLIGLIYSFDTGE